MTRQERDDIVYSDTDGEEDVELKQQIKPALSASQQSGHADTKDICQDKVDTAEKLIDPAEQQYTQPTDMTEGNRLVTNNDTSVFSGQDSDLKDIEDEKVQREKDTSFVCEEKADCKVPDDIQMNETVVVNRDVTGSGPTSATMDDICPEKLMEEQTGGFSDIRAVGEHDNVNATETELHVQCDGSEEDILHNWPTTEADPGNTNYPPPPPSPRRTAVHCINHSPIVVSKFVVYIQ